MQDVALLAVSVVQERQTGRAVRVVFNRRDLRRNALFLTAEIDGAVMLLVAAAAMPDCDVAMGVASARALLRPSHRFFSPFLSSFSLPDRFLAMRLVCGHCPLKDDGMLRFLHPETLLGDDGAANHVIGVDIHHSSLFTPWAYFLPLSFFAAGFFAEAFFAGAAFFLAAGLAALGVSTVCAGAIVTISGASAPVRGPSVVARRTAASFDSNR